MTESKSESILAEYASNIDVSTNLRTDVAFSDDDLSEQAKEQFKSHTEALRAQQLNARSIACNDRLSPIGRHLFCIQIEKDYMNYKNVLNYVAAHPEIRTVQLKRDPLIISGLPRTGTTLLYNLLACDPTSRAPLIAEMSEPILSLARSDNSGQMQTNNDASTHTNTSASKTMEFPEHEREARASHPSHAIEEDYLILQHAGVNRVNFLLSSDNNHELLAWWMNSDNRDFAYEYHKTFIQMLNSIDAPQSHWLLKAPTHTLYLNSLLRFYPNASLVMIHRRLDEVLPSAIRLLLAIGKIYLNSDVIDIKLNRNTLVEQLLHRTDIIVRRLVDWRRVNQNIPLLDLYYEDLVAQPIDTVRRIYKHFGLAWSEEFEMSMLAWLRNNPQGSQGRNLYTLDEFGLDRETIEKSYKEYYDMFLKARD